MNKTLILLLISLAVLVLSVICVTVAPIINNLLGNFTSWGKNNCQFYSDVAKYTKELDGKKVLNNVSFQLLKGDKVAVLGSNSIVKTLLLYVSRCFNSSKCFKLFESSTLSKGGTEILPGSEL